MTVYLIPGLGFDCRIFSKFNFQNHEVVELNWLEPHTNESWEAYATRIASKINIEKEAVLVGHSQGGMIAQEISAQLNIKKLVLISTITAPKENPWYFKILASTQLYRLVAKQWIILSLPFWANKHDYNKPEYRTLFKNMLSKHNNRYLRWALKQLSIWKPQPLASDTKILRIHGTNDQTFPLKLINGIDIKLKGGGHFLVYKRAKEIRQPILDFIKSRNENL